MKPFICLPLHAVLISALFTSALCQFNFQQCHNALISSNGSLLNRSVDINGNHAASIADARGFNYPTCLDVCGPGVDASNFSTMASQYTLWFLPYLTLLAQTP